MKWTLDLNVFIIRAYFQLTRLETDMTAYMERLYQAFVEKYPDIPVTAQRIADQRRVIIRNKLLSDEMIAQIKNEVAREQVIDQPASPPSPTDVPGNPVEEEDRNQSERRAESESVFRECPDFIGGIRDMFAVNMQEYMGMDPTRRPRIPKQKTSKKFARIVEALNNHILPTYLGEESFQELHDLVYCAALAAAKFNGAKIPNNNRGTTERSFEYVPEWRKRLVRRIETKRAEIARLLEYSGGSPSRRLKRRVSLILEKYKVHTPRDRWNTSIPEFVDTLKQKLGALTARLRRYTRCDRRKWQNRQFDNDERRFYRGLRSGSRGVDGGVWVTFQGERRSQTIGPRCGLKA